MTTVPSLELRVVRDGAAVMVYLGGELDLLTAPRLSDRLAGLIDTGAREVTVDLAALEFIDSSGLHVIVSAVTRLREQGGDLAVRSANARIRRIFEITGLTTVLTFVAETLEATGNRARSDAGSP